MDEPRQITVEDLLREPARVNARIAALTMADTPYCDKILFGKMPPPRRRFDPRRLIDRWRPRPMLVEPPIGGSIVYTAQADDLYARPD